MKDLLKALILMLVCSTPHATDCPDMKKTFAIIKELRAHFSADVCSRPISQKQLAWVMDTALPTVMSKDFLGVEPPSNWPVFANQILVGCYHTGDLCTKNIQEEFVQCAMAQLPIILFQLGPWMGDNCLKLNKNVLERWPSKRPVVMHLINDYLHRFNS